MATFVFLTTQKFISEGSVDPGAGRQELHKHDHMTASGLTGLPACSANFLHLQLEAHDGVLGLFLQRVVPPRVLWAPLHPPGHPEHPELLLRPRGGFVSHVQALRTMAVLVGSFLLIVYNY